ncbi:MAG TPA: ferritin-like domain-containing protein [Gemmatimonadales bacterium]|nr:ferritin-like domain-containing protein [Gemmatimonadales bacterium]
MKLTTLDKLFHHELKDLYDAEHQVVKALPKLAEAACNPELAAAFEEHLAQTQEHISRLETVFEEIGESPAREPCAGMRGIIEEGNKILGEDADPVVKDAAIISAAQRVEHYEMAVYGTLRTWARILGYEDSARLLEETLDEEEGTDSALTGIAQQINPEAAANPDSGEEEDGRSTKTTAKKGSTAASGRKSSTPRQRTSKASTRR